MNIFWIIIDGICNYERADLHGLLPVFKKLKNNKEGFYFEHAISQFPSTNLSLLSFLTGRFPYYLIPDYYRSIENLPSFKDNNNIYPLKKANYNIQSIIFGREQANITKDILNPYITKNMYPGDHWLNAKEVYQFFIQKMDDFLPNENNFFFLFFRASDPQTDLYLNKTIDYFKNKGLWENSIFIFSSDHGYYDRNLYKKRKYMHFDDIHQSSMVSPIFMKLPTSLTKAQPKTIKKEVYLIDIMETVLDYLNLEATHERESISFKELIEGDIDVNKDRKIRGDCYLMFQSIKKTMILKDNWKFLNNNGKFYLYNLSEDPLEKVDVKNSHPKTYNVLFRFYLDTEKKAYEILKFTLKDLYNQSILASLESENILIPNQFPPQLVIFLKENLKIKNNILKLADANTSNSVKNHSMITILFYNRMTGYGLKKLQRRYQKYTKRFIILDTELYDVSYQIKNTGYLKFVIKSLIKRRKLLLQRWKEILVWILYFPLYFNKHIRKFYI